MKTVLEKYVQVWLDDVLGYVETEKQLLNTLEVVTSEWKFPSEGISHWASRVHGVRDLAPPETTVESKQVVQAAKWISNDIPNYMTLVEELQDVLEIATQSAGSRKKKRCRNHIVMGPWWSSKQDACLQKIQVVLS